MGAVNTSVMLLVEKLQKTVTVQTEVCIALKKLTWTLCGIKNFLRATYLNNTASFSAFTEFLFLKVEL